MVHVLLMLQHELEIFSEYSGVLTLMWANYVVANVSVGGSSVFHAPLGYTHLV